MKIFILQVIWDSGVFFSGESTQSLSYQNTLTSAAVARAKSDSSFLFDADVDIGYSITAVKSINFRIIPNGGWSWNRIYFKYKDKSSFPSSVNVYGRDYLISVYHDRTKYKGFFNGPYIGAIVRIDPIKALNMFFSYDFHWIYFWGRSYLNMSIVRSSYGENAFSRNFLKWNAGMVLSIDVKLICFAI